jgi:hypothetical protein
VRYDISNAAHINPTTAVVAFHEALPLLRLAAEWFLHDIPVATYLLRHTCCDIPVATHEARTAIARLGSKERISSETVLNYSSLLTFAEWSALAVCDSNEPAAVG